MSYESGKQYCLCIWKPLKCYNHGIYLVYTRHMTKSVICQVYIPGIYLSYEKVSHMSGIYQVYTFLDEMSYVRYIPGIYLSIF